MQKTMMKPRRITVWLPACLTTLKALLLSLSLLLHLTPAHAVDITPSSVYAQAVQVEKEIELLRRHFKSAAQPPVAPLVAEIQPRHVWQMSYMLQIRLNILRRKHGLSGFAPVVIEPDLKNNPRTWGQMQRLLTEIRIIKTYLGVTDEISPATPVTGKRMLDVFNKLNQIAIEMDALNGEAISPSAVYAEALRLNADVNALMHRTGTVDTAVPPARQPDVTPKDSLRAAFGLMEEIQRLQRQLGVDSTDFSAFDKQERIAPADVFNLIGLCLAEIQLVKTQLGMKHSLTPPAEFKQGKIPADVVQLLGYVTHKLQLVKAQ